MELISVVSSNIAAIGYDSDRAILEVDFLSGAAYEYYDVPEYIFDEFLAADSKGKYGNVNIYKVYRQQRIR